MRAQLNSFKKSITFVWHVDIAQTKSPGSFQQISILTVSQVVILIELNRIL